LAALTSDSGTLKGIELVLWGGCLGSSPRVPTPFERAGIAWWNGLTKPERTRWFEVANTGVVAVAYRVYLDFVAWGEES
jgi:hypothetical protein